MTRFSDLLLPGPSTPGEEQRRASNELANVVTQSRLLWWKDRGESLTHILLVVAPYSQYDLTLLDILDESFDAQEHIPVYVANLLDYATVEQLSVDVPGITTINQTPILAVFESGLPTIVACGKKARETVVKLIG